MKGFDSKTRKEDPRSFRHFYTLLTHTWSLAVSLQSFPKSLWWEHFSQTCSSLNLLSQHSRGRPLWVPGQLGLHSKVQTTEGYIVKSLSVCLSPTLLTYIHTDIQCNFHQLPLTFHEKECLLLNDHNSWIHKLMGLLSPCLCSEWNGVQTENEHYPVKSKKSIIHEVFEVSF